jgi:hypothetical protein
MRGTRGVSLSTGAREAVMCPFARRFPNGGGPTRAASNSRWLRPPINEASAQALHDDRLVKPALAAGWDAPGAALGEVSLNRGYSLVAPRMIGGGR